MRASTLFALTVAVLIGLGVAVAAKTFGLFSPPREPEAVVAKKAEILVLAAANNLFKGDLLDAATSVKVRPLKAEELTHYNSHKDEYLSANPQMVYLRVASSNIETDQPLLRGHLNELAKPELLPTRLVKNMRAFNLAVPKERSAGGLITVGEWVDVMVTSTIDNAGGPPITRTACVAPHVRVVAKRNTLWPVYAPLPEGKPVHFTLEVNAYRAALIEYVSTRGSILLMPLAACDQKSLEEKRQLQMLQENGKAQPGVPMHGIDENEEESARMVAISKGELAVGEGDMARLFGLTSSPPPGANIAIERYTGIHILENAQFGLNGSRLASPGNKGAHTHGPDYRFSAPTTAADCPTCGTNNTNNTKAKK